VHRRNPASPFNEGRGALNEPRVIKISLEEKKNVMASRNKRKNAQGKKKVQKKPTMERGMALGRLTKDHCTTSLWSSVNRTGGYQLLCHEGLSTRRISGEENDLPSTTRD